MAMAPCDDVGDADWYTYHVLGDLNLLCSSSSSYAMAAGSRSVHWTASVSDFDGDIDLLHLLAPLLPHVRAGDCLPPAPIAAAPPPPPPPPPGPGVLHLQRCKTEVLEASSSSDAAFAAADCFSSALMNLQRSFQQLLVCFARRLAMAIALPTSSFLCTDD